MLLVMTGSIGMQAGAAISLTLFDDFGAAGTSGLRMLIAGVIMLAVFRPRLRGRSSAEWVGIVLYGTAMATMNLLLYQAIERLPLGVATTLDFLGPCMVAFFASRRLREGLLAIAAFTGVVLIAGFGGPFDPIGLLWGALAGVSFAGYTLLAPRVGQSGGSLQAVALALGVAAILTTPFSVPLIPTVAASQWGLLALSALLGTALTFSVDTIAGKLTSARTLGVFFAVDPVTGTLIGAIFLEQMLAPITVAGILLVVFAGGGIVWLAGRSTLAKPRTKEFSVSTAESSAGSPAGASAVESLEIEQKFDVPGGVTLPGAEALSAEGLGAGVTEAIHLAAEYFDTSAGALGRQHVAVRRRTGGGDEGWHVKERREAGVRELHWPLSDEVPAGLMHELREWIGDEATEIRPIARILTERQIVRVQDDRGREVVEVADDLVRATELRGDGSRVDRAWREWEAELLPGAELQFLDRVARVLRSVGAVASPSSSKIGRAMGLLAVAAEANGADPALVAELQEMDRADRRAARKLGV